MNDHQDHRLLVRSYLTELQNKICDAISEVDGAEFQEDKWSHANGGGGITRVLSGGSVIEKGGVNFSHVLGKELPPAATNKRPELAGKGFEAMGVSLVMHPHNPHAPTTHMNVRFFIAGADTDNPVWWFGGGFDMTPYYGYQEDAEHWHQTASNACQPFGESLYKKYKAWCDDYFKLPHRNEQRGIGCLFFDDLNELGFDQSFSFMQSVGDSYLGAYLPILNKRKETDYGEKERHWQLVRRGRYVEFNLVFDRGTLFGLQSGGRIESILMSMPPLVAWEYRATPDKGSREETLLSDFLVPKDWV